MIYMNFNTPSHQEPNPRTFPDCRRYQVLNVRTGNINITPGNSNTCSKNISRFLHWPASWSSAFQILLTGSTVWSPYIHRSNFLPRSDSYSPSECSTPGTLKYINPRVDTTIGSMGQS